MSINLLQIQQNLFEWQIKNFGVQPDQNLGLGMAEESGEISHAILKRAQGIRGFDSKEKYIKAITDGVIDHLIFGMNLLSKYNVNIEEAIKITTDEVLKRDWKADKVSANIAKENQIEDGDDQDQNDEDDTKSVFERS